MGKSISISISSINEEGRPIWVGDGRVVDGRVVDCAAALPEEHYEAIEDAIEDGECGVDLPGGYSYVWEVGQ